MTYWIGVDEAGYGPNLGPLVVCGSVWNSSEPCEEELWEERLFPHICRAKQQNSELASALVIDDSKLVYQSGKGLSALERSVLALARLCGGECADADTFRAWLDPHSVEDRADWRWRMQESASLPTVSDRSDLNLTAIRNCFQSSGIGLSRLAGRIVHPANFNRRLAQCGNKSSLLSAVTMELVQSLIAAGLDEDVVVLCDKHGGRDRYYALLCHYFPDSRIEIVREGEELSIYRWISQDRQCEIRFTAKGERFLPTAAASMTAKYVRELCMAEWNAYWARHIPDLIPTAGYPVDAKRFRRSIEGIASELGFEAESYWRQK
jgi:hypothetical protein